MNLKLKYGIILSVLLFLMVIPSYLLFQGKYSLCVLKELTKIECPLCGMTRACYNIVHMHFSEAMKFNPIALFIPLLLIVEITNDITHHSIIKKIRIVVIFLFLAGLTGLFIFRIASFIWN